MISIDCIKKPVAEEFKLFDTYFKKAFETNNEILNAVNHYILENKGKQIRPILTFLSAKICGTPTVSTVNAAVALELLHTASLVHDDIVDDTFERRGTKSVNAVWKNKIAVLVGDFLLAKSLSVANQTKNFKILDSITNLGKELSEGELLQVSNTKNVSTCEQKYFDVITKKTATLFSTCTTLGAVSIDADNEKTELLRKFGEIYGICFQIKDDIFDYISSKKEIGKPVGNDIKEGKITLPLLYALNNAGETVREKYIAILKKQNFSEKNVEKLISFAIENGGIEYAEKQIIDFKNRAVEIIKPFPESEIKEALLLTLEHTTQRKK
jgi:octaprenyl-diphosphate synthase